VVTHEARAGITFLHPCGASRRQARDYCRRSPHCRAGRFPVHGDSRHCSANLAKSVGYALPEGWIVWSVALYFFTGAFWLPVVFMQMRMRDLAMISLQNGDPLPPAYHRLFWWWFVFGLPAFAAVLVIFWLMITRPPLPVWIVS
jgi:hypothetical protein